MKPLGIRKEDDFKVEAYDQPLFIMNAPISNKKNCSIYDSIVIFFINLANIWWPYVLWTISEVNWTLQHQCFLDRGQRQFSKSQILIMRPV